MGFFSFKTADTQESIANEYSGKEVKPVYLLQPNGLPAIKEPCYSGYGVFGGVDCNEWLAKFNLSQDASPELADFIDYGSYYEDDNAYYVFGMPVTEEEIRRFLPNKTKPLISFERYNKPIAGGKTPNDYIKEGLWKEHSIELKYPLKFSFDPKARYENLPASKSCEYQGFFYD